MTGSKSVSRAVRSVLAVLMFGTALVTQADPVSSQAAGFPDRLVWLALGDSYSSGEGLERVDEGANPIDRDCQRATGDTGIGDGSASRAWPVVAYDDVRSEMTNSTFRLLACTGAISNDVHRQYREEWLAGGEPKADLVTISAGGNNLDFDGIVLRCIGFAPDNSTGAGVVLNPAIGCDTSEDELRADTDVLVGDSGVGPDGMQTLRDMYIELAEKAVNPGGHIVVTGYPNLVEESGRWRLGWFEGNRCSRIRRSDTAMLRSAAGYLNQQIALLVEELDGTNGVSFSFVDTARIYESDGGRHGLCTGKPWINGITIVPRYQRSFHPTQDGHDALGNAVATSIRDLDWSQLNRPVDPPAAASCVRGDIDFAAVRDGATTSAAQVGRLEAGECGIALTGATSVLDRNGEVWLGLDLDGTEGWTAARLFDVPTLPKESGFVVAFSQVANEISGGGGGPSATSELRSAVADLNATVPWSGSLDGCTGDDNSICSWWSSDDITEVGVDVELVWSDRTWSVGAVWAGSCGGANCGGLGVDAVGPGDLVSATCPALLPVFNSVFSSPSELDYVAWNDDDSLAGNFGFGGCTYLFSSEGFEIQVNVKAVTAIDEHSDLWQFPELKREAFRNEAGIDAGVDEAYAFEWGGFNVVLARQGSTEIALQANISSNQLYELAAMILANEQPGPGPPW